MNKSNNKIGLKDFRLWLLHRDQSLAAFSRTIGKSRRAVYGALKAPDKYPRTFALLKEAVHG